MNYQVVLRRFIGAATNPILSGVTYTCNACEAVIATCGFGDTKAVGIINDAFTVKEDII